MIINEIEEITFSKLKKKNITKITLQHVCNGNIFLTETYTKRDGVEFWDYFSIGEEPEDESYGTFSTQVVINFINETIDVVKEFNIVGHTGEEHSKCNLVLE